MEKWKFIYLIGKKFLNKKSFPYGKKLTLTQLERAKIDEHEVKF